MTFFVPTAAMLDQLAAPPAAPAAPGSSLGIGSLRGEA